MLFNSLDFAVFLPIVFFLYWFVAKDRIRLQNLLIVLASYFFYGWWDWRFLALIFFSSIIDFTIGILIPKTSSIWQKKTLLWTSIIVNLGFLGFFKYYNFFLDNFVEAFSFFGSDIHVNGLNIVLPVGISFYTFQTLSYTIDVYRDNLNPSKDFIGFSAFVSFFPQLVAGPIERATNLLPQFYKKRVFDYTQAVDGLRQILWGLFKKIIIADKSAEYVNMIFDNSGDYSGSTLVIGAFLFAFQIYGDFSGYSDIAIGTSRLFGFNLMRNFAYPYFSRDIAEFWRRWHISLSTWFRDYLYIPLGGSKGGTAMKIRNTFIIFIVSGFWHGANWTFIAWGLLNALYFLPLLLTNNNRNNMDTVAKDRLLPNFSESLAMLSTFGLTLLAWVFFRADSIGHAITYLGGIFSISLFSTPELFPVFTLLLIGLFISIEWIGRDQPYAIAQLGFTWKRPYRWAAYFALIAILFVINSEEQQFIYFQF